MIRKLTPKTFMSQLSSIRLLQSEGHLISHSARLIDEEHLEEHRVTDERCMRYDG